MMQIEQAMDFIKQNKKVAIVGLSPKEDRPSHRVAKFLMEKGCEIVPVNPVYEEILGKPCVKKLSDLTPGDIDWVDMFVNSQRLMDFKEDIVKLKPGLVWCQIGVVNDEFNKTLEDAQIPYIADVCPKMEWEKQ